MLRATRLSLELFLLFQQPDAFFFRPDQFQLFLWGELEAPAGTDLLYDDAEDRFHVFRRILDGVDDDRVYFILVEEIEDGVVLGVVGAKFCKSAQHVFFRVVTALQATRRNIEK